MVDILDAVPKELVLVFLSGYLIFLVKNWDSFSLLQDKNKQTEFSYVFRESAFFGIILYAFFAVILSLNQSINPVPDFANQISPSSAIFSLSLAFSLLLIKAIYPRLVDLSNRSNAFFKKIEIPRQALLFITFFILILVIYFIIYRNLVGTFNIGLTLLGIYFISREVLTGVNWEKDAFLIIELILFLIVIFSVLLALAFSKAATA